MTAKRDRRETKVGPASRKGLALALLSLASFVGTLSTSVVTVALPSIGCELDFSAGSLQWVLASYSLVSGGLLLLGGRAGDLFGRRRLLLVGLTLFALASMAGGLSASPWMLLAARTAQGMGAAAFVPASLSLVTGIFEEGSQRDRAVGIYSALGALGFATGIVLGGVLTQLLGWRSVMFAAVPIALSVLLLAPSAVPESRDPGDHRRLDLPGSMTVTLGLASLLYALSEGNDGGWTSRVTLGLLALGIVLLVGFVLIERRARAPLVPLSIFRIRPVAVANAAVTLHATSAASTYVLTLYLQDVLGRSPLESALTYLPVPIVGAAAAPVAGRLIHGLGGPRPTLILGLVATTSGWLLMVPMRADGGLALVIAGGVIASAGRVATFVATAIIATSALGEGRKGLASGMLNTSGQLGGAWGLGVVGAIISARTGAAGGELADPEVLVTALRWGAVAVVAFVALALVIVLVGLRGGRAKRQEPRNAR